MNQETLNLIGVDIVIATIVGFGSMILWFVLALGRSADEYEKELAAKEAAAAQK